MASLAANPRPHLLMPWSLAWLRSKRLCPLFKTPLMDWRKGLCLLLNKITIKNKYPIPLIADLFNQLGKGITLPNSTCTLGTTKLTCQGRWTQYRMHNKVRVLRIPSMPFDLTNVLATFCTLMNKVLQLFLDHFVVVYLNDIVVYNTTLEEHT